MTEFDYDIRELAQSSNIDTMLTKEQRSYITNLVLENYQADRNSRRAWEKRMEESNKLALQVRETKSTPWRNASNVKFPLLTVATLQFSSRAYPALVKAPDIVKCRVIGSDPQGKKKARANRISTHMSYQILEEDEAWEEQHDKLFMVVPIAGCAFKKSYYSAIDKHNKSELVLPQELVVNYFAKSVEDAEVKTHVSELFPREVRERQLNNIYSDVDVGLPQMEHDNPDTGADDRQEISASETQNNLPFTRLEQHLYLDLDGDGYPEPYVATVLKDSQILVRLVNRFERINTEQDKIIQKLNAELKQVMMQIQQLTQPPQKGEKKQPPSKEVMNQLNGQVDSLQKEIMTVKAQDPIVLNITAVEYFTKYGFIPSPDGGFYDLGFGALLGPVNESVNTIINQLIDAGTMQNGSTGFIGRGARIAGGEVRFKPYEWKRVKVAGQTLRDSIVPLPINEPSIVLFNLLGLMIQYGERIASVTDAMVGENPGQNTPAYTSQQMLQQGMAVFGGIFKRLHRAQRDEFRKLYKLNRLYLSEAEYFQVLDGPTQEIFKLDYQGDPRDVKPAADPNAILSEEKMRQASVLAERAQMVGGYNPIVVEMRLLEAIGIQDVEEVFPLDEKGQPKIKPPPDPEFEIKRMEEQRRTMEAKNRDRVNTQDSNTKTQMALGQLELIEAQTAAKWAEIAQKDDKTGTDNAKVAVLRIKEQREALMGMITAGNEREKLRQERARTMATAADNSGGAGSA